MKRNGNNENKYCNQWLSGWREREVNEKGVYSWVFSLPNTSLKNDNKSNKPIEILNIPATHSFCSLGREDW